MSGFHWISPRDIRFYHQSDGWLAAEWGIRRGPVTARRLFPVSEPEGMILIRDLDGQTWGMLKSAQELDPGSREALRQELRIHPYLPEIRGVTSLRRKNQLFEWEVLTDFGPLQFCTEPLYESVHERLDGRRMVTDKAGQCYVLPAEQHLDKKSLKKLKKWL